MRAKPLISIVLLAALAGGYFFWQQQRDAGKPKGPMTRAVNVEMVTARIGDAPVQISAIGQIVSSHSVAIRPQVSGTLLKVFFTEGDDVKAGDKLFEIDAAPYRAELAQAEAQFANADEKLWPGTFVSFTATLDTETNRVLVPEMAVQPGAEGSFVYVVDAENKAKLNPVKVARQVGKDVVIAEGLKGGEQIISRAPRDLKPGATVQVAGSKPAGERGPPQSAGDATPKAAAP